MYGYTPREIADMTPYQQEMLLGGTNDNGDELMFDNMEDLRRFRASRAEKK